MKLKHLWLALLSVIFLTTATSAQPAPDQLVNVVYVGPGGNLGVYPITTSITRVDVRANGVEVQFDKRQGPTRWPDRTTPGWQGPLQYSLGMVVNIDGQWTASAPIETWYGNNSIGGDIADLTLPCEHAAPAGFGQIHCNWFYDGRWAPLNSRWPLTGETIGLFVVAGDARNGYTPQQERSNIVVIKLPAPGVEQAFTFAGATLPPLPEPAPVPIPAPAPSPSPAPLPSTDLSPILAQLQVIAAQQATLAQVEVLRAELRAFVEHEDQRWAAVDATWKKVLLWAGTLSPAITTLLLKLAGGAK